MIKNQVKLRRSERLGVIGLFIISVFGFTQITTVSGQEQIRTEKSAPSDPLSGKYEGMVKSSPGVDTRLTLEITDDKGKLSGRLVTPQNATPITEGTFTDGKLTLKFGSGNAASTLVAQLQGEKLTGDWTTSGQKLPVELRKVPKSDSESAATVPPAVPEPVSLSGDWDGIADAQGQGYPFSLSLKVEGERVTGESSSTLGVGTITNGSWKDGKLVFQVDTPNGVVAMSAVIKEGGLVGDFDLSGQVQGRWVAKKRTP